MHMMYALLVLIQFSHAVSRRFYTNPNANPFGDFALGSGFDMTRYEPTGTHVFSEGASGITYDIMPITNTQTRCAIVTSAKELTDKLYVYGEISVTYNMITGSGFVSFDQKEEKMRRKSYYSCTIDRTLFTVSVNAPEITEEMTPEDKKQYLPASLVQQSDGDKLRERIGDYHVQSITYGRRYQTEVELAYTNEDTYQKIAGEIEAKIGVGALTVSAKVKVELESENKEDDFSMVIASEAFGFLETKPLFLPSTADENGTSVEQQVEAMLATNLEAFNQADQNSNLKAETDLNKTQLFAKLGDAYPLSYTIASNDPYYDNGQLTALQEQRLVQHVDLAYDIKRELQDLQITIERRAERLFENYHLLSGATDLSIKFLEVRQQITDEIMGLHEEVNEYLEQTPKQLSEKDVYTWARNLRILGEDKKLEHISLDLYASEVWQLMGMEDAPMEDVNPVGTTCLFNGIQATMDRDLDTEYKLKFAGRVIFGDVTVRHVLFDINGAVVSLGFIDHTHADVRPDHCPERVGEACHELVFVREDCTLLKKGDTVWFEEGRYIIDKIGSDEHMIRGHVVKEKLTNIRIQIVSEDADRGTIVVLTDEDIHGVTLRGFHSSYDLTQDLAFRLMYSHGYVCDSGGFSASEAKMVCTHLGYANLRNYETGQKIPTSNAWDRPFVTLWDLHCDKYAMELSECDYKIGELGPEDWDKCGSRNGIFILCSDEQLKEDDVKINIETTNAEGCVLQNWEGKKEPSEVCSGGSADQLDAIANVQIQGDVCLVMYQLGEVQCVIRGENDETYDMTEESVRHSWCYNSFDSDMFPDELELVSQYPRGKGCLDMEANLAELEYIDVKTCAEGEELGLCAEDHTSNTEQSSEKETIEEENFRRDMEKFRDLCVKTCNICPEVVNEQYYTITVIAEESSVLLHNYQDPIPVRVTLLVDNLAIGTRTFGGAELHSFGDYTCGSKIELIFEPEDLYDHGNVVCEARGVRGIRMENNVGFVSGEVDVTFSCRFPPSASPSLSPSVNPSTSPSCSPSVSPTTDTPSATPSTSPSVSPTTDTPSVSPSTTTPSVSPSTATPSMNPSTLPSFSPIINSVNPTTSEPTTCPTYLPTSRPTNEPTLLPTMNPTVEPTDSNRGLLERKWENYYEENAAADFDWFNTATQIGSDVVVQSISKGFEGEDYSYSWYGYFCPTELGTYIFETTSDDASHVVIGTETIVDNGGIHHGISVEGSYSVTSTDCKPISIYYGQRGGGASMSFRFKTPPTTSDWQTDLSTIFLQTPEGPIWEINGEAFASNQNWDDLVGGLTGTVTGTVEVVYWQNMNSVYLGTDSDRIEWPLDVGPTAMPQLTLEIVLWAPSIVNNRGWILGDENGGCDRYILIHDDRIGGVGSTCGVNMGLGNVPTGEWVHIIATWDQTTGTTSAYLNGVGASGTKIHNDGNGKLRLGSPNHRGHHGEVYVAEARAYGYVLSDSQVQARYMSANSKITRALAYKRSFARGATGIDACMVGYIPIRDTATCEEAASVLGLEFNANISEREEGPDAVCNYCGGCTPQTVRLDDDHGELADWICISDRKYHLAPPGAGTCDYGETVSSDDCEAVSAMLVTGPIGRPIQFGSAESCSDSFGSWGSVPPGCSAQVGGDNTAHYQSIDLQCDSYHPNYQLVCETV